jgi:quinol monooxygenase YgiN
MKKISRRTLLQSISGGVLVTIFGFLSKGCGKNKKLPKTSAEQISLLALIKAKPGKEEELKKELMGILAPTRSEEGCINYTMHTDPQDPSLIMFYENWASQAALDKHLATPHITAFGAKAGDLLAEPLDLTQWKMVD